MIVVHALRTLASADLNRIASGYSSDEKYIVAYNDSVSGAAIEIQLVALKKPYVKKFHYNEETLRRYGEMLDKDFSFGAYDDELLVGFIIAEAVLWDATLWVHEFHVVETHRKMGIGKQLMEFVAEKAKRAGLRIIVCETQNTNAAAIKIYRRLGFRVHGIDLSYYSNNDYPDGEIAIFMKRGLPYFRAKEMPPR